MNVIGIGGVFLRTKKLDEVKKWYKDIVGISLEEWNGTVMLPKPESETVFSFFKEENSYFPIEQQVMLNFQVENMEECLKHLEKNHIPLVREIERSEFGIFACIEDPEGRWIELWEKKV